MGHEYSKIKNVSKMTTEITPNFVKLGLTQARGKVRIADGEGNHIAKPTTAKKENCYYIEWMITNDEIDALIKSYLNRSDKRELASNLSLIRRYLKGSQFATRKCSKEKLKETFLGFEIFKYQEKAYSFEKRLESNILIRSPFKMGDFTLTPHLFVLLPFEGMVVSISNQCGPVGDNETLGSKCYAIWKPTKKDIFSIIVALAHASESHKRDLLAMLSQSKL